MKQWCEIRMRVLRGEASIRQIQRETGLHYETVKKMLLHPSPPEFRCPDRSRPKLGPYLAFIADTISADKEMPKKQRHTAKRIFELIREQGYEGGYTQVKEAVRELKRTSQEKFVPRAHAPGEAQMDFGMAVVNMNGKLRKVMFFAMVLSHSGAMYVRAYPRECTETFQDGHVQAFRYYGGVPTRISYDNAKTSVSKIIGVHARKLADGFLQLQSHYLFEEHFCRVRQPNEKGIVEGVVKFARLNFLVPVPQVRDFDELNAHLEQCCQDNLEWRVRGRSAPKKELLKEDQTAMLPLPEAPFDACRKASTAANKFSLVRFDCNDYSVPVRYAHHTVVAKGYVDHVRICKQDRVIAEHARLWDREAIAFEPLHYLELLERKPGALDYPRPLSEWKLPESFQHLRTRLEEDAQSAGTREFIRVLQLLEKHSAKKVSEAIDKALRLPGCNRDVVAQYLYADEPFTPPTFRLEGREHLQGVVVQSPDLTAYRELIASHLREGGLH